MGYVVLIYFHSRYMRKLLLIAVFSFISTLGYGQVIINNMTDYDIGILSINACIELGIDSIFLEIDYIAPVNEGFYNGYAFSEPNGKYIIRLARRPDRSIEEVLCHELIHIKQLYKRDLIIFNDTTALYMSRIVYLYDMLWSDRPFEKDAMREGDILYKVLME